MFAMTEKGHGSNVRQIQTEATFDLDNQVRDLFPVSWFSAIGDLQRPPIFLSLASHLQHGFLQQGTWTDHPIVLSLAPHPQHVLWLGSLGSEQVVLWMDMSSTFGSNTSLCFTLSATNRTQLCTHTLQLFPRNVSMGTALATLFFFQQQSMKKGRDVFAVSAWSTQQHTKS